jgi:hypothetical protein
MLESPNLMQYQNFDALIYEKEHKFNNLERKKIIPKYRSVSLLCYREDHENEEFEQRVHNLKPPIPYVVEQEVAIQGIRMSRGVESIFVIRQETIVLPRIETIVVQGVHVAIKVRYSEPKLN